MKKEEEFMKRAFETINQDEPVPFQKDVVLQNILNEIRAKETPADKIKKFLCTYPWRAALILSTAQSLFFTLLFGTGYTNLILQIIGG